MHGHLIAWRETSVPEVCCVVVTGESTGEPTPGWFGVGYKGGGLPAAFAHNADAFVV